ASDSNVILVACFSFFEIMISFSRWLESFDFSASDLSRWFEFSWG
ncbi:hypothetical protein A2U01_0058874, partial [Trifolium medium]|nr:hypothetical protein [Trifolium medium]